MPSLRQTPVWILALILLSALAVLFLGFHFAKERNEVVVEQDRAPLVKFATQLLKEIESLEVLYQDRLLETRNRIGIDASEIAIAAACREMVGIEQATVFPVRKPPIHVDLRETDRSIPLPLPRRINETVSGEGLLVDIERFERSDRSVPFQWQKPPGHPPHFLTKIDFDSYLLLRINPTLAAKAADSWLEEWVPKHFSTVETAGVPAVLENPRGRIIASTVGSEPGDRLDFHLPISSVFGTWKVSSPMQTKIVTTYRYPIMIGSSVLAIILVLAGLFGFAQQNRALRLAEQRVSFVNRVSHELRTPMLNILLNVDLLSDPAYGDGNPKKRTKRLGLIREEANRLSRLLENVLSFSRREKIRTDEGNVGQDLRIQPCPLEPLVDEVLSHFATTLERKGIEVIRKMPDPPLSILADPDAFSQVLGNLVSNVEKYAAEGERFEISAESSNDGNHVTLAVTDFGPGIPRSEASRIFRPFVRISDSTSDGVSGTGLGLAIARDLTESLDGTLELDSPGKRTDQGARFVLTLPRAADNIVEMAG